MPSWKAARGRVRRAFSQSAGSHLALSDRPAAPQGSWAGSFWHRISRADWRPGLSPAAGRPSASLAISRSTIVGQPNKTTVASRTGHSCPFVNPPATLRNHASKHRGRDAATAR